MITKPAIIASKPRSCFVATEHMAVLLSDVETLGIIRYVFLLVVHGRDPDEPVLIVSSERLAGGPSTVLGVFDENGHHTLYEESGDWSDELAFTSRAFALVRERLQIELRPLPKPKPWWKWWG